MKDSNYVMVFAWMTKLNLSGNELLIFALIHGFSQDGESKFTGSSKYICDVLNIKSKTTVKNCIKSLIEKGYVHKTVTTINGITFNKYSAKVFNAKGRAEIDPPSQKLPGGRAEIDRGGRAEIDPNNNNINNNNYNIPNSPFIILNEKKLTEDEVADWYSEKFRMLKESFMRQLPVDYNQMIADFVNFRLGDYFEDDNHLKNAIRSNWKVFHDKQKVQRKNDDISEYTVISTY